MGRPYVAAYGCDARHGGNLGKAFDRACGPPARSASRSPVGMCVCITSSPGVSEAHVDGVQRHEAAEQQTGAGGEHDGKRDSQRRQWLHAAALAPPVDAPRALQRGDRADSTRAACQAGARPNTQTRDRRRRRGQKTSTVVIDPDFRAAAGQCRWRQSGPALPVPAIGKGHSECAADESEQEALDASADGRYARGRRRGQREVRSLASGPTSAREQEIGDVGTGD